MLHLNEPTTDKDLAAPNAATEAKDTHDQGTGVITDNAMIIPSGIDAVNALIEFNKQPKQPEPTPRPNLGRSIFCK